MSLQEQLQNQVSPNRRRGEWKTFRKITDRNSRLRMGVAQGRTETTGSILHEVLSEEGYFDGDDEITARPSDPDSPANRRRLSKFAMPGIAAQSIKRGMEWEHAMVEQGLNGSDGKPTDRVEVDGDAMGHMFLGDITVSTVDSSQPVQQPQQQTPQPVQQPLPQPAPQPQQRSGINPWLAGAALAGAGLVGSLAPMAIDYMTRSPQNEQRTLEIFDKSGNLLEVIPLNSAPSEVQRKARQ